MDAGIAALLGAAIGAASGFIGPLLIENIKRKQETTKLAAELGLADFKFRAENADTKFLFPLALYVDYHARALRLIADNNFNAETMKTLSVEQDSLTRQAAQEYLDRQNRKKS